MIIRINNIQKRYRLDTGRIRKLAMALLKMAIREAQSPAWKEAAVVLTDNAGIEAINRLHLSRQETTDVISFNYTPLPGEDDKHSGDIIVNVQRAVDRSASCKTVNASKELALYIAHGFDHLTGGRDDTSRRRARMRRTELRWLKTAGALRLTGHLIRHA